MSLSFYTVEPDYCNFLRKTDNKTPFTKNTRPFAGVVFKVNNTQYYAPLTSPKTKHLKMKNTIDFVKIDGGKFGAINLNNMIPVHEKTLNKIEVRIYEDDSKEVIAYKNLLSNQLTWCNKNREKIIRNATKLYSMVLEKRSNDSIINRCCNFEENLKQYSIYCMDKGF